MKNKQLTTSESGVTLLLAVLVLSAITAISFSLATVVFTEIRASGDLQRTEPALYATQGVIEQSIFKVQRDVDDATMCFTSSGCTTPIQSNISVVQVTSVIPQDITESPLSERVPFSYNTFTNTKNVYAIYDADSPNNPTEGYTKIRLENRSPNALKFTFCRVNDQTDILGPIDCTPPTWSNCSVPPTLNGTSWLVDYGTVPASGSWEYTLNKTYVYRLYLYQQCNQTSDIFVDIYSWGPTGSPCLPLAPDDCPKGLPLKGKKQIDVTAANAGLTRRYRVLVPLPD